MAFSFSHQRASSRILHPTLRRGLRRSVRLSQTPRRFTFVWCERGDINQAHDFGFVAGFGNDCTTIGMPYQKERVGDLDTCRLCRNLPKTQIDLNRSMRRWPVVDSWLFGANESSLDTGRLERSRRRRGRCVMGLRVVSLPV